MEIAWQDWLGMMIRWLHLATGIAWIGTSFFFIWLDLSLRRRGEQKKTNRNTNDFGPPEHTNSAKSENRKQTHSRMEGAKTATRDTIETA